MNENIHNIDDLFKKAIDEYEEAPSSDVWDNIDHNLDKRKLHFVSMKYRKLKWVAAALLIFSAGMAMYTWSTRIKNRELVHQNSADKRRLSKKNTDTNADRNIAAQKDSINAKENATRSDIAQQNKMTAGIIKNGTAGNAQEYKNITGDGLRKAQTNKEKTTKNEDALEASEETGDSKNVFGKTEVKQYGNTSTMQKAKKASKDNELLAGEKQVSEIAIVRPPTATLFEARLPDLSLRKALVISEGTKRFAGGKLTEKTAKSNIKGFKKSLFSTTLFYSPEFVSSKVDNDKRRFREDDRDEIESKENIKSASSVGVLINYNISKLFSIETGITFSAMTTSIQPKTIYARPDDRGNINYRFNCLAGYTYVALKPGIAPASGDSISALSSTNTLKYISVPIAVKYKVKSGRFSLQPGLGIAANFLTKGKIETVLATGAGNEKASISHIDGLNKSFLNSFISLEAVFNLNGYLALSFTPQTRFALTAINKDAPVKTYLNSFGLAAGLNVRL